MSTAKTARAFSIIHGRNPPISKAIASATATFSKPSPSIEHNTNSSGTITEASQTSLRHENVNENVTASGSPYVALDHFLSICSECNKNQKGNVQIVARGSSKLSKHQASEAHAFISEGSCIIAIVAENDQVDPLKLESVFSNKTVQPVPLDQVLSICGFLPGNIPPLGHFSPLLPVSVVMEQDLLEQCQLNDLALLGGGGHAYWRSVVAIDTLLSLPNIYVAPITTSNADVDSDNENAVESTSATSLLSSASTLDIASPIPFSAIEPPPMNIAKLVVEQRELSNPLTPSLVSIVGKVGKVESKGKRLATFEFLSLQDAQEDNKNGDEASSVLLPWQSVNGETMRVQLTAGKMVLHQLGTTQGEIAIQNLKEGMVLQIQAKTNVGNRESLVNWVDNRILDLVVMDYQIFTNGIPSSGEGNSFSSSSPYKHKPKNQYPTPALPSLTLKDIFGSGGSINIIKNRDTLHGFAQAYDELVSQVDVSSSNETGSSQAISTSSTLLVGIDCEWQPKQLMHSDGPRQVLLMQLSLQALQKVYLFDCLTLFRPLLPPEEPMNELELAASEILGKLFASKRITKTGYQLASDFQRLAASYPHIPCFRQIESVLEVDAMVKRILQLTKQKKSRSITMSLARMTSHYLGKTVDKECQVSDWVARPLTSQQVDYAALDAASTVALAEKALESIDAQINRNFQIERFQGDEGLSKAIESLRFFFVPTEDPKVIKKLQAKQVIGSSWIATQTWITNQTPPELPTISKIE